MSGGTVNFTAVMPDDLRVETARHEEGHLWVLLAGGAPRYRSRSPTTRPESGPGDPWLRCPAAVPG